MSLGTHSDSQQETTVDQRSAEPLTIAMDQSVACQGHALLKYRPLWLANGLVQQATCDLLPARSIIQSQCLFNNE